MNDVKLQEGHPVDENLRPIKVGGKSTALEVSKEDVRVNNLHVSGNTFGISASDDTKLPLAGGTMTDNITFATGKGIVSNSFILNDAGNIELNADGGTVVMKDDTAKMVQVTSDGSNVAISVYDPADNDDYTIINVGNNAATSVTTVGSSSAHLTLDIAGDITLDSNSGNFISKKAGTEFSVANSSYAGMILGYTTVGIDAADDSYTLTSTMTCLDDAMKVKFVAPPSGVVEIFAQIYFDAARRYPVLGLSDENATTGYSAIDFPNANDVTNEHVQTAPPSSGGDQMLRPHWVVTGLTAGTAYEWWFAAKTAAGTGGVLKWGGNVTNEYPPFIMKATALPAAVSDYAVYG